MSKAAACRWSLVLAAGLAGCGNAPVQVLPAAVVPAAAAPAPVSRAQQQAAEFERRQQALARSAESQGRWADAALAWELLTLLQPGNTGYREALERLRARIAAAAAEKVNAAQAAQRRGELDIAAQAYLEALALAPGHAGAADALRAVERERNRRSFVGKFSRITLTRRAVADGEMRYRDDARAGNGAEGNHLEHATLLLRQGEADAAIGLLREALRAGPADAASKALLAEAYVQKGERLLARDSRGARQAAEAALELEPRNAGALGLLQRSQPAGTRAAPSPARAASGAMRR